MTAIPAGRRLALLTAVYCVLAGALLPVVAFALVFDTETLPGVALGWRMCDPAVVMLYGPASRAFYPLLAYSIAGLVCGVLDPEAARGSFLFRWATYSGVLLAAWFGALLAYRVAFFVPFLAAGAFAVVLPCLAARALRTGELQLGRTLWLLSYCLLAASGPVLLMLAPFLALAAFLIVARHVARAAVPGTRARDRVLVTAAWLAALSVTWRVAWARALADYALLPATPPEDCFVVSAAARGHAGLVGPRVRGPNGRVLTRQLLRLKGLELAVATGWPSLHRRFRAVYDVVGPVLARRIRSPWAADVAWLCLKPAEALAILVLAVLRFPRPTLRCTQCARRAHSSCAHAKEKARENPGLSAPQLRTRYQPRVPPSSQ